MEETLEVLVTQAQRGDREALGRLIELTQDRLLRFCLVLCRNKAQAEEVLQETYLRAFEKIEKLSDPKTFVGWLFKIAKNLYLDEMRSAFNRLRADTDLSGDEAADGSDMSEVVAVREALSQFDPKDRFLLMLVDMENMSYREAGDITGLSETAVKSRIFRLRKAFLEKYTGT